jgi:signal transduction histidine kinase
LYAEVQHKEHIRGELFKKAINAQEDERKRIARELHDDTSQALTAMLFAAEESLEMNDLSQVKPRLEKMRELAQRTLDGVHKVIFDLRPTMLDHLGLVPALRWFAVSWLEEKGIRVTVEDNGAAQRLPSEVETALFRVVQEAIVNISRHAGARNVCIYFQFEPKMVTVRVEDDGVGFELDELSIAPGSARGLGLIGMQERVELFGGELEVTSTPGYGTQVYIRLPLANEEVFDA